MRNFEKKEKKQEINMFRQWKGCAEIFQVGPRVSKNSSLISSLKNSQIFLGELGERAKQFLAEGTVESGNNETFFDKIKTLD